MTRELDIMVAERVMGWEWDKERIRVQGRTRYARFSPSGRDNLREVLPHFSTDIRAAWLVAETITRSHRIQIAGGHDVVWTCEIYSNPSIVGDGVIEYRDTASLAICIAALRAVGVPKEEIAAAMEENHAHSME